MAQVSISPIPARLPRRRSRRRSPRAAFALLRNHALLFLRQRPPVEIQAATADLDLIPLRTAASAPRYPQGDDPPFDQAEALRRVRDARIIGIVRGYLDDQGIDASGILAG